MSDDWYDFDSQFQCEICGSEDIILPFGNEDSPVLIISDSPNKEEVGKGKPFTGAAGRILKKELKYNKIGLKDIRTVNVWKHPKNGNDKCYEDGYNACLKEAKNKQLILLLGSDAVKAFAPDAGVKGWEGLEVNSILSAPHVMVCPNPTQVFKRPIGEVRLSIRKFCDKARELLWD